MPAPASYEYSAAAKVAAHTAVRDLLDAQNVAESGVAMLHIYDASDVLLASIPLDDPCGTVNGTTGQLTLTATEREESAPAAGTAAYGEFCDAAGAAHLALPAEAGVTPVSGKLVLNTLTIIAGGPVELVGATVG